MRVIDLSTTDLENTVLKRLQTLRNPMENNGISASILFEGDSIAYKLALTRHFNIVLVTLDEAHVLADVTLYHKAVRRVLEY